MDLFLYLGAFFVAVFVLTIVHELGHFFVARWFDVKIVRFSLGYGKPFYRWQKAKDATEYVLAPILLGGYVKVLDTRDTKTPSNYDHLAFNHKTIIQRLAIILAGPLANTIFAFLAFWLMLVIGYKLPKLIIGKVVPHSLASVAGMHPREEIVKIDNRCVSNWREAVIGLIARIGDKDDINILTKELSSSRVHNYQINLAGWNINSFSPDPLLDFGLIGYKPVVSPRINEVIVGSPAQKSGLQQGDMVIRVYGKKIDDWEEFIREIKNYPEQKVPLLIQRNSSHLELITLTGWKLGRGWHKIGYLGVRPDIKKTIWPEEMVHTYKYGVFSALNGAAKQMWFFTDMHWILFTKLFSGKMSFHVLSGPLAILTASGEALAQGFVTFVGFLATISLAIAFINLLPVPGLDGGYVVLLLIEAIMRRPLSLRVQMLILRLGMALLVVLVMQTTANDLIRFLKS